MLFISGKKCKKNLKSHLLNICELICKIELLHGKWHIFSLTKTSDIFEKVIYFIINFTKSLQCTLKSDIMTPIYFHSHMFCHPHK